MRLFSHTIILKSGAKVGVFSDCVRKQQAFFAVFENSLTYIMKFLVLLLL